MPESATRMVAMVRSENDSVGKEISLDKSTATLGQEELRIFSNSTLKESIAWRLYRGDTLTKETIEKPRVLVMEEGAQFMLTFGHIPFYPMAKTMPASLAAAWGFIDSKYALLALEQDTSRRRRRKNMRLPGYPA